mmetsp:Transcript_18703/g.35090  ORF Transcript_18703/g.35090 Transcript_18703/m.35090 type:complete len:210 (+) Transcript_18703:45-674(+)
MAEPGGMSMQEVADRVMLEFRDLKFQADVETFINCHIEEFAVVHFDGSCPMNWMNIHRKYKKLYEDRLLKILDDCDADCTKFMEYFSACSEAYGHDNNFKELMTALTASEDFFAFRQLMFDAVRENWEPDENQKGPVAGFQYHQVEVSLPETAEPGTSFLVNYLGQAHAVTVPPGAVGTISVTLQVPECMPAAAPDPPPAPPLPAGYGY